MSERQKIKILCVEDEKEIRENICEILRDEGFEVIEAINGKYGFSAFIEHKPDLIISDIMMPDIDGYKMLSMIRETKNSKNNNVPFIFLTALGQKDDLIKGISMTANDYLIKPIDFDLMIAKINEKIDSALKIKDSHNRDIENIKGQFAFVLPSEVFAILESITQVSSSLKKEPYGPFCHERYLQDIEKIYNHSLKLKTSILNALDSSIIDHKLNADEEIISISTMLLEFIEDLSDKFKDRVDFESMISSESPLKIRIDRVLMIEALKKILAGVFKSDPKGNLKISAIIDHFNQLVLVFRFSSKEIGIGQFFSQVDEKKICKILDKQNCRFEIIEGKEKVAMLSIPSYRLVE